MRYKDFVQNPRAAVRLIAGFAHLPVLADDLRFLGAGHADLTTSHTVAGNPMRFRTDVSSCAVTMPGDSSCRAASSA